ncbi:Xaa-Pro aminopeptidase [Porphyromonas crevioricanis JCM 15906]|uniref:Peptidase M24 n=2 Tax=Porphyromonas crevioricanis TaxID=393921 RepID=A0AB34PHQ2_9PORP|nr:aminopeptidase P family protein [Porphyromonas crevioricanis]KGN95871.1 peptidase M24 [Porphyromonas crevioricanis]GAD06183.1 Xaa-Pro aminopeptidase [Porphyromonas crevioricanis JCM 15906]SJZ73059.1 Xaa-Pro aminopeptidase [Porphyromonas crevioricanis]
MQIKEHVERLRAAMHKNGFKAYIIPSSDAHLSEYTPEHWKARLWISGFSGSAGTVLITPDKAGLWTDSRYFLQAEEQLRGSGIKLYKEGLPETPGIDSFLTSELQPGDVVACDGRCYPHAEAQALESKLEAFGIRFDCSTDLFDQTVWPDRPAIPTGKLFGQLTQYSGETAKGKIARCRKALSEHGANCYIINMLDELAWIFNIRGKDVECNPVGVAYGFVSEQTAILFVLPEKIDSDLRNELEVQGITLKPYGEIYNYVSSLSDSHKVLIDGRRINEALYKAIPAHCRIIEAVSPITLMKAVKNEIELQGVRNAMKRDGVALTRFFIWLEKTLDKGLTPSEVEIGEKLTAFRALQDLYFGDSFDTIAGYQGHGAIVHYRAEEPTAYRVKKEGVLLLDSGGQYFDGTTDITRTISLDGKPSKQLQEDYTLVMKGHIAIATAQYLEGTRGNQIDVLARKPLWDRGLHYGHGTGHGVGCFLNVHEGPQNIRMEVNPTPLKVGMITSNEPGIYRADQWGIRIENLVVTKLNCETDFGRFFGFETLTLCYFDNNMIDKSMLTEQEIEWYNAYQERVYKTLSPLLSAEEALWLKGKTQAI